MKGYIIKEVSTATADNPLFKGETQVWYYGINEEFWKEHTGEKAWLNDYKAKQSCYKRRWQAEKQMRKYQKDLERFWNHTFEIVEVDCQEGTENEIVA